MISVIALILSCEKLSMQHLSSSYALHQLSPLNLAHPLCHLFSGILLVLFLIIVKILERVYALMHTYVCASMSLCACRCQWRAEERVGGFWDGSS